MGRLQLTGQLGIEIALLVDLAHHRVSLPDGTRRGRLRLGGGGALPGEQLLT